MVDLVVHVLHVQNYHQTSRDVMTIHDPVCHVASETDHVGCRSWADVTCRLRSSGGADKMSVSFCWGVWPGLRANIFFFHWQWDIGFPCVVLTHFITDPGFAKLQQCNQIDPGSYG